MVCLLKALGPKKKCLRRYWKSFAFVKSAIITHLKLRILLGYSLIFVLHILIKEDKRPMVCNALTRYFDLKRNV